MDFIQIFEQLYIIYFFCFLCFLFCDCVFNMVVIYCFLQMIRVLKRVISLLFCKDMVMSFYKLYMLLDRQGVEWVVIVFCRYLLEQVVVLLQFVMIYSGLLCRVSMNLWYVYLNMEFLIFSVYRGMFLKFLQWWLFQFFFGQQMRMVLYSFCLGFIFYVILLCIFIVLYLYVSFNMLFGRIGMGVVYLFCIES